MFYQYVSSNFLIKMCHKNISLNCVINISHSMFHQCVSLKFFINMSHHILSKCLIKTSHKNVSTKFLIISHHVSSCLKMSHHGSACLITMSIPKALLRFFDIPNHGAQPNKRPNKQTTTPKIQSLPDLFNKCFLVKSGVRQYVALTCILPVQDLEAKTA